MTIMNDLTAGCSQCLAHFRCGIRTVVKAVLDDSSDLGTGEPRRLDPTSYPEEGVAAALEGAVCAEANAEDATAPFAPLLHRRWDIAHSPGLRIGKPP